ncbi:MAG: hypothetical protein QOE23_2680, partial [Pseudonocardiales bacterium]|nr:hypothetical protein [Pseudonocardiales bacterium]
MIRVLAASSAAVLVGGLLSLAGPTSQAGAATLSVPGSYRTIG